MSKTKIQDKTYIGELPQKKNYIEIDGRVIQLGDRLSIYSKHGYFLWPTSSLSVDLNATGFDSDYVNDLLSSGDFPEGSLYAKIETVASEGGEYHFSFDGVLNTTSTFYNQDSVEIQNITAWGDSGGENEGFHFYISRLGIDNYALNVSLWQTGGSKIKAGTTNLELFFTLTQESIDKYWDNLELPYPEVGVVNYNDWNTSWNIEDLTGLPENGVIWKVESEFSAESPFDDLDWSKFENLGLLQLTFKESIKNIWTVEIRRFSFESLQVIIFDEAITEDDFNAVASIFNVLTIGKLIHYGEDTYNVTEQYGYLTYVDVTSAIGISGNGKYRHLTLPTSLFANWLFENEENIKAVLQVNETLVSTVLITTMTYEWKPSIKDQRTIEIPEQTEDPDNGSTIEVKHG